ncbi:MAG: hypothetical protein BMS9Abin01_0513 [Gammaproteobacteria bacterium]|nr:MAG: hypothetical protein BMS9Abin01_0513 [Gammaproteobacteria bacterium]
MDYEPERETPATGPQQVEQKFRALMNSPGWSHEQRDSQESEKYESSRSHTFKIRFIEISGETVGRRKRQDHDSSDVRARGAG